MKYQRLPDKGDLFQKVEITFFAWLPIKIGIEVRWLETVTVQYQYNFQTFYINLHSFNYFSVLSTRPD